MPAGHSLIGICGLDYRAFSQMGSYNLHAKGHARCVNSIRQSDRWITGKIKRRGEPHNSMQDFGIRAIVGHFGKAWYQFRNCWTNHTINVAKHCRKC